MKAVRHLLALVALALAATAASAQFVKGNEAVKVMPDGTKKVETPPLPATGPSQARSPAPQTPGATPAPGTWSRRTAGLLECTEPYARPGDLPRVDLRNREAARALDRQDRTGSGCSASTPTWPASAWTCSRGHPPICRSTQSSRRSATCSPGSARKFDAILSTYVLGVVTALMAAIAPIALTAMTLWVALYGWAVLRNEVSETVAGLPVEGLQDRPGAGVRAAVRLLHLATSPTPPTRLAMGVATTFLPAASIRATVASPYALLDKFNDDASQQVADIMKEAGIIPARPAAGRRGLLDRLGGLPVHRAVRRHAVEAVPDLRHRRRAAVHPLPGLAADARFFDSWLSMVLNAVVLTWFAFFALGLSAFMGKSMFMAIQRRRRLPRRRPSTSSAKPRATAC